jgi:flavin-dependent dehydrogenase
MSGLGTAAAVDAGGDGRSHGASDVPASDRVPLPDTRSSAIRADVAIIGAGPAGLAAAIHLGQLGVRRVVVVDRQDFPRDTTCGSAISPKGIDVLKALGADDAVAKAAYWIKGLRLVTPDDREFILFGHTDAALICCRRTLDHILLRRAVTLGARFIGDFQASYLLSRNGRVAGFRSTDDREVLAKHTVVADGVHSRFSIDPGRRRLIQAIMGWWDGASFEPHRLGNAFRL